MAPSSPDKEKLEAQLRQCFGRVAYTHKTHEKCADILIRWSKRLKTAYILLSAITTGGFIFTIFGQNARVSIAFAILSFILLALTLYNKEFNMDENAEKHKKAALMLWDVRESYISLLTDLDNLDMADAITKRDELQAITLKIYEQSPRTNSEGYSKAQKALKKDEELYFSDKEIDDMLNAQLKKTKQ